MEICRTATLIVAGHVVSQFGSFGIHQQKSAH